MAPNWGATAPTATTGSTAPVEATTPTETPTAEGLRDRSAEVLGFTNDLTVVDSTTGTWGNTRGPVTITIYGVEASETTTRLLFNLQTTDGEYLNPVTIIQWPRFPTLFDPVSKQKYYVNTYASQVDASVFGVYTEMYGTAEVDSLGTAQFPPLDPDITTVTIETPGFESIENVPVTRK